MTGEGPFTLYRWWDENGSLVYLGITNNAGRRLDEHQRDKPWARECAQVTLQHLPEHWDRAEVLAYESRCIRQERPRRNIAGNGGQGLRAPARRRVRRKVRLARRVKGVLQGLSISVLALAFLVGWIALHGRL